MKDYNGFTPTQRLRAYRWLMAEYAAGRRQRPTACQACGQTAGIIEAHSENYSAPYGDHIGEWSLCYRCHMMVHVRFAVPEAWRQYKAELAAGVTFAGFEKRSWFAFRNQHVSRWAPFVASTGPARQDVLSKIG